MTCTGEQEIGAISGRVGIYVYCQEKIDVGHAWDWKC